jgi:Short C-terminal domain
MGLIRGVTKTAVAAGAAKAVTNRLKGRQDSRWAQQGDKNAGGPAPSAHAAAPAPGGEDRVQKLKDLADLKAQGVLTDEEFAAEKARVLNS